MRDSLFLFRTPVCATLVWWDNGDATDVMLLAFLGSIYSPAMPRPPGELMTKEKLIHRK